MSTISNVKKTHCFKIESFQLKSNVYIKLKNKFFEDSKYYLLIYIYIYIFYNSNL